MELALSVNNNRDLWAINNLYGTYREYIFCVFCNILLYYVIILYFVTIDYYLILKDLINSWYIADKKIGQIPFKHSFYYMDTLGLRDADVVHQASASMFEITEWTPMVADANNYHFFIFLSKALIISLSSYGYFYRNCQTRSPMIWNVLTHQLIVLNAKQSRIIYVAFKPINLCVRTYPVSTGGKGVYHVNGYCIFIITRTVTEDARERFYWNHSFKWYSE